MREPMPSNAESNESSDALQDHAIVPRVTQPMMDNLRRKKSEGSGLPKNISGS